MRKIISHITKPMDLPQKTEAIFLLHDNTNLGGAELSLLDVMRQYKEWGIRIYLITSSYGKLQVKYDEILDGKIELPFPYKAKPLTWLRVPSFISQATKFISKVEGNKILWIGDIYPTWAASLLPRIKKMRIFGQYRGEYRFQNKDIQKWIRFGANKLDKRIVSPFVCQHMNKSGLINEVLTLTPSLDEAVFDLSKYNVGVIRKRMNWGKTDKIAICASQISETKGQLWLIHEFLKNKTLMKHWKLILAGPGNPEIITRLTEAISQRSEGRIEYIGVRNDVAELLAAADLAVYPGTIHENYPRVLMEAIVMKCPFLCFNVGANPYILKNYPGLHCVDHRVELITHWASLREEELLLLRKTFENTPFDSFGREAWKRDLQIFLSG